MFSKIRKFLKIKKKTVKKTKKSTIKRAAKKRPTTKKSKVKTARKRAVLKRAVQSAAGEELVGVVTHYFPHVKAGVIKIKKGSIAMGNSLHVKGHTTDFIQKVNSLQIDRKPVQSASKGKEIGFLAKSRVRHNDKVYKLK